MDNFTEFNDMSDKKEDFSSTAIVTAMVSSVIVGVLVAAVFNNPLGHIADIVTFITVLLVMK